jgi:hypothetical protein
MDKARGRAISSKVSSLGCGIVTRVMVCLIIIIRSISIWVSYIGISVIVGDVRISAPSVGDILIPI